ncbi:MAG: hypothetical protein MJ016_00745 [Victivallaceae bacterium]|nr:hypothetical protein [Victivallaceae bacterium]
MTALFSPHDATAPARTALFLSGTGSNAEAILRYESEGKRAFRTTLLVTDAPDASRAEVLAEKYDLPLFGLDIKKFYLEHGESSIRLDSEHRRAVRDLWSDEIFRVLLHQKIELVLLAGFVPLTNIAEKLPALNVHPADLTQYGPDGRRLLAGLHYRPVETALLSGHKTLRSSVIQVQPYRSDADIDAGPVLGVSAPLPVDLGGATVEELQKIFSARTPGKSGDKLRELAAAHVERLKTNGDHIVFPQATEDFARGAFATHNGQLYYYGKNVAVVEYTASGAVPREK